MRAAGRAQAERGLGLDAAAPKAPPSNAFNAFITISEHHANSADESLTRQELQRRVVRELQRRAERDAAAVDFVTRARPGRRFETCMPHVGVQSDGSMSADLQS